MFLKTFEIGVMTITVSMHAIAGHCRVSVTTLV